MADARQAPPLRFGIRIVRGRSMQPTLVDGDRLMVRTVRPDDPDPPPGSLVVVRLPDGRPEAVKRLVRREPEGWWVERDNPDEGVDSWLVGAIAEPDLIGVVLARVWPRPRLLRPRLRPPGPSPHR
jgi:signal peptidase I